jgi:hypothetical protein
METVPVRERDTAPAEPVQAPAGPRPAPAAPVVDPAAGAAGLADAGNAAVARLLSAGAAPAAHQQTVLARVASEYGLAVSRVAGAVDGAAAAVAAAVTEQQQAVDVSLDTALARTRAEAAAGHTRVDQAAGAAAAHLPVAAAAHRGEVDGWLSEATSSAEADVRTRQDRIEQIGREHAAQAAVVTESAAAGVAADGERQLAAARDTGQARLAAGGETEPAVQEAQQAAAGNLTADTTQKVAAGAGDTARAMRQQNAEVAAGMSTVAGAAVRDLAGALPGMREHLTAQAGATATAVDAVAGDAETGLDRQRQSAGGAVDRATAAAVSALQEDAAVRRAAVAEAGRQGIDDLHAMATEVLAGMTAEMEQATRAFGAEPVDAAAATEFGDVLSVQLTAAGDQWDAEVARRTALVTGGLGVMSADAAQSLGGTAATTADGLARVADGAGTAFEETAAGARAGMSGTVQQTRAAGTAAAARFGAGLDGQVAATAPAFADLTGEHTRSLGEQRTAFGAQTADATGSLDRRIATAQERAAQRARRSWLANQLSDLWDAVTSPEFLVGLVVGLAVAVIIVASAGTATPFVIMAAGVAAGAAGAAAGTMTGNYREGRRGWDLLHNVGRNALYGAAAGAVGAGAYLFGAGLVAGLGLTGTAAAVGGFVVLEVSAIAANTVGNLLAGEPWDKNLLTAMLLAPLIQRLAAKIPALRGGRPPMSEIDPTVPRVGDWTFESVPPESVPEGLQVVRVEATLSGGRGFGHAQRAYNPATGEFQAMEMHLHNVPPELRFVDVGGRPVPLSDYLTMRIMRQLQVPAGSLRTFRIVGVENVRAVLELEQAVRGGTPADQAVLQTQAVRYNERAITSAGGGRVLAARVEGGSRVPLSELLATWEGTTPPPDMVARHNRILQDFNLTREQAAGYEVHSNFDVVLSLLPAEPVTPLPRTDRE